jgi:hypothetical protein
VLAAAAAVPDLILAVHILAAVIGFGIVFAYPLLFSAAARREPAVIPWLLRTRQRLGQLLVNPGLLIVLLAGIYLASDGHHWGDFYVQWGIAAVVVIGAVEGAYLIPRAGRLAIVAERDLAGAAVAGGGQRTSATWSPEYLAGYRALTMAGTLVQLIVVITVFLMAGHAGT